MPDGDEASEWLGQRNQRLMDEFRSGLRNMRGPASFQYPQDPPFPSESLRERALWLLGVKNRQLRSLTPGTTEYYRKKSLVDIAFEYWILADLKLDLERLGYHQDLAGNRAELREKIRAQKRKIWVMGRDHNEWYRENYLNL